MKNKLRLSQNFIFGDICLRFKEAVYPVIYIVRGFLNSFPLKTAFISINLLFTINVFSQSSSFDEIFPDLNREIRNAVFSSSGYVRSSKKTNGFSIIANSQKTGIDPQIVKFILDKNPGYVTESIYVIPVASQNVSLLNVYNALGKIRDLKGRLYDSATRKKSVPLFEDATRVVSEKNTSAIPDPPSSLIIPLTETIYIKLKDINFGNSYYRGEITLFQKGLRYSMTNFKSLTYLFFPVIKEGKFIAQLYFEPINEGLLIYSLASADISDFYASKIDINSAITKRLAVIISWAEDGISVKK
jgi:hypothetical protein